MGYPSPTAPRARLRWGSTANRRLAQSIRMTETIP